MFINRQQAAVKKEKENEHESLEKRFVSRLGSCLRPDIAQRLSANRRPTCKSSSTGKGGHVIAANTWGVGAYPLDIIFEALTPLETSAGDLSIDLANNEFKVDKVVTDLQNQLTSGADGVLFLGMSQTIFPTVAQLCQNFEVPFVFHANIPADADWPAIQENAYYTGAVISQEYAAGAAMGELGLADGNQTAIISAAALGDYVHDQRIAGFTDTFEAGGGEVVYVAHSAAPSEGVQKANDFMTAYPDADMIYCTGGDYLSATISAMSSRPEADYKLYGSDMSPETAQSILDGDVTALNGGQWIAYFSGCRPTDQSSGRTCHPR